MYTLDNIKDIDAKIAAAFFVLSFVLLVAGLGTLAIASAIASVGFLTAQLYEDGILGSRGED